VIRDAVENLLNSIREKLSIFEKTLSLIADANLVAVLEAKNDAAIVHRPPNKDTNSI
jgi:hypothetical protein